ncbi:MAG: L,D-transpeptidase [Myxococcales bacterium]
MPRRLIAIVPLTLAFACGQDKTPPASPPASASPSAAPLATAAAPSLRADAGAKQEPVDSGQYEGPFFGATVFTATVMSDMEWPSDKRSAEPRSVRLGYLRHGGKTPVIAQPHKKSNCNEGWYELVAGGYVCGKYGTLDLKHPRFRLARTPDLNALLPYPYGMNGQHGTPLYKQVPSKEDRARFEPWRSRPKPKKPEEENPYETMEQADASDESDKPWYLQDAGGPPQVTLNELRSEGGIVARRMVRGFYLSLDRQFASSGSTWWRTIDGLIAPADRIWPAKTPSDFHGIWLGAESKGTYSPEGKPRRIDKLPVGFVLKAAHKWTVSADKKRVNGGGALHRFSTVGLTGATATVNGVEYWETDEGWWLRALDGTKTEPGLPPERLGKQDKWIDVNLARQTLVAFEGERAVFATLVSSGRPGHDTPPGTYRVREKHIASTMDGDAETASDGPYSIQDVPYIQYFSGGYAFHGAFWHGDFGKVKSHGCVNLAPWDARGLFGWTEPSLPDGWHGVWASSGKPGTRVVVHK